MDKSRHFLAKINSFERTVTRTVLSVLAWPSTAVPEAACAYVWMLQNPAWPGDQQSTTTLCI
jgi:hypothetical protein